MLVADRGFHPAEHVDATDHHLLNMSRVLHVGIHMDAQVFDRVVGFDLAVPESCREARRKAPLRGTMTKFSAENETSSGGPTHQPVEQPFGTRLNFDPGVASYQDPEIIRIRHYACVLNGV